MHQLRRHKNMEIDPTDLNPEVAQFLCSQFDRCFLGQLSLLSKLELPIEDSTAFRKALNTIEDEEGASELIEQLDLEVSPQDFPILSRTSLLEKLGPKLMPKLPTLFRPQFPIPLPVDPLPSRTERILKEVCSVLPEENREACVNCGARAMASAQRNNPALSPSAATLRGVGAALQFVETGSCL